MSRRTKQLCEGFFVFEDLGEFQVKGKSEPVRAYAVNSEISGRTRLEVSRERGLTPLVGRDPERQRLAAVFRRRAADGRGASSLHRGRCGRRQVAPAVRVPARPRGRTEHLELETTCASYGRAMAYRPIVELYRGATSTSPRESSPEEISRRVAERLQSLGLEGEEPAILLAHFLGVSAPPEFLIRMQGAQLKERTHERARASCSSGRAS